MNVIECIEKRHSTRQFSDRRVEKENWNKSFTVRSKHLLDEIHRHCALSFAKKKKRWNVL